MPIALPLQPRGNINLPPLPNDPPSLQDVVNAKSFSTAVKIDNAKQLPNTSTKEDKARASVFKTHVIVAHSQGDAAPAWFVPTLTPILNEAVARANDLDVAPAWFAPALTPILNAAIARANAPLLVAIAQIHNIQCHDGKNREYKILPFSDGSLPTDPQHNLPKLGNVDNIKNLLPHQCTAYLAGYGLGYIHSIDERKRSIGREVGCPVPVV